MFCMTYLVLCVVIFRHLLYGLMFNFILDFILFSFPFFLIMTKGEKMYAMCFACVA